MFHVLLSAVMVLVLSACTEVEFASHVAKNAINGPAPVKSQQQGTFKVGKPYNIAGKTYYPKETYSHSETGIASWYGPGFQGKKTASGETFDTRELTAAHRTLQMPSLVRVTNLENGKSVIVRVNDRGPFARGRVIDVSQRAAELLEFKNQGTAKVRLDVLPEESVRVAEMAKQGQSTKGVEVAMNQYGRMPVPAGTVSRSDGFEVASYGSPAAVNAEPLEPVVPVHQSADGRYLPDPVVTQMPVRPSNIYVQAGSFTVYENAEGLKASLGRLAQVSIQPAMIRGQQFYRVRVGPATDVASADRLLAQVIGMGQEQAIIVVD